MLQCFTNPVWNPFSWLCSWVSVVKFWICRSLPFLQEESVSSPRFLTLSWRQQIDFSLVFSSPGWINLAWWTPAAHSQLAVSEVPVDGTLLSSLPAHPGNAIQCGTVIVPSPRALEQLSQPHLNFGECHLLADSWLLFKPWESCELPADTAKRSLLTLCSSLQSMSLQSDSTDPAKSVSKPCKNQDKLHWHFSSFTEEKNRFLQACLALVYPACCSQWPFYASCAWKLISWGFMASFSRDGG